jgi:hypothetical protein
MGKLHPRADIIVTRTLEAVSKGESVRIDMTKAPWADKYHATAVLYMYGKKSLVQKHLDVYKTLNAEIASAIRVVTPEATYYGLSKQFSKLTNTRFKLFLLHRGKHNAYYGTIGKLMGEDYRLRTGKLPIYEAIDIDVAIEDGEHKILTPVQTFANPKKPMHKRFNKFQIEDDFQLSFIHEYTRDLPRSYDVLYLRQSHSKVDARKACHFWNNRQRNIALYVKKDKQVNPRKPVYEEYDWNYYTRLIRTDDGDTIRVAKQRAHLRENWTPQEHAIMAHDTELMQDEIEVQSYGDINILENKYYKSKRPTMSREFEFFTEDDQAPEPVRTRKITEQDRKHKPVTTWNTNIDKPYSKNNRR